MDICLWCEKRLRIHGYSFCEVCFPVYYNCDFPMPCHGAQGSQGPYHIHDANCSGEPKGGDGLCKPRTSLANWILAGRNS